MRGTPAQGTNTHSRWRIIPAHAGNSSSPVLVSTLSADHPRACGELLAEHLSKDSAPGSSPRMRGNSGRDRRTLIVVSDHPRACGELAHVIIPEKFLPRIIPAHAGNSRCQGVSRVFLTDHPRACGELKATDAIEHLVNGSSPRMRGTLVPFADLVCEFRIIPAHAGNSGGFSKWWSMRSDHPRACGELQVHRNQFHGWSGSSPRMRGTRSRCHVSSALRRIIPAHAGNSVVYRIG